MPTVSPAHSLREVIAVLFEMIEDCQREANYTSSNFARCIYIAKRDALTELRLRIRDGKRDSLWVQRMPPFGAPSDHLGDRD